MVGAVGAGLLGGAIGGGLAVTVLAPLTAANNFLGSYFFGSGMILGERQMYQDDWIKIKKRLDAGESFLIILEEVMKPNTQAVMQMARETVIAVSKEWNDIVLTYLQSIPQSIWDAINKINAGEALPDPWPLGEGIIGIINGKVQCAAGYHQVNNTCVKNTVTADTGPDFPSETIKIPVKKIPTTGQQPGFTKPVTKYNVSAAALKLYTEFQSALAKLNKQRIATLKIQQIPAVKKQLANINLKRTNKFNQIAAMEKSYPDINAAWKNQ